MVLSKCDNCGATTFDGWGCIHCTGNSAPLAVYLEYGQYQQEYASEDLSTDVDTIADAQIMDAIESASHKDQQFKLRTRRLNNTLHQIDIAMSQPKQRDTDVDELYTAIDGLLDLLDCKLEIARKHDSRVDVLERNLRVEQVTVSKLTESRDQIRERLRIAEDELAKTKAEMQSLIDASKLAPGWVYLIREKSEGHYKIGKTTVPLARRKKFEVVLPFKIEPICEIHAANHHQLERDLHAMFADKRVDGEWFALDDTDVNYIRSLA